MEKISLRPVNQHYFQKGAKSALKSKNALNNSQNQKFELPSYNLSFGMAKIINCKNNPEFTLPYKKLKEINDFYSDFHHCSIIQAECEMSNGGIFPDFNCESAVEILHYLRGNRTETLFGTLGAGYVNQFLNAVDEIKDEDKKKEVLEKAFLAKDFHENSFLTSMLSSDYSGENVAKSLEILKDYPEILCKALSYEDSHNETAGVKLVNLYEKFDQYNLPASDKKSLQKTLEKLNEAIYRLAAQTEEISVEDSKTLLENNKELLDGINANLLSVFDEQEFEMKTYPVETAESEEVKPLEPPFVE